MIALGHHTSRTDVVKTLIKARITKVFFAILVCLAASLFRNVKAP